MSDLIDRQAAIDAVRSYMADNEIEDSDWHADGIAYDIKRLPSAQPTIEAEPVKHGRWDTEILTDALGLKHAYYACSVCGKASEDEYDYCPHCGAKMDEVEEI